MPNGRLFVHKLDLKEMKENFEVRIVVEALVARKSATLCTDKQIDDLEHLIDQVEEVINAEDEKSASIAIDLFQKFHSSLLDIADNRKCRKILNDLEAPPIKRYGHYSIISERRLKDSFFEHKEIFNFIADKNPEKAEAAMKEHIQNVGSTVLKQIQKLGNITSK